MTSVSTTTGAGSPTVMAAVPGFHADPTESPGLPLVATRGVQPGNRRRSHPQAAHPRTSSWIIVARGMEPPLPALFPHRPRLLRHLLDPADEEERLLRQVIVLPFQDGAADADRLLAAHPLPGDPSIRLGDE